MKAFSLPAFAKLSAKISRAVKELEEVEKYFDAHLDEISDG